jgi:hypothetical protein
LCTATTRNSPYSSHTLKYITCTVFSEYDEILSGYSICVEILFVFSEYAGRIKNARKGIFTLKNAWGHYLKEI